MAIAYYAGRLMQGLAADRTGGTWTNLPAGWRFLETDTLLVYYWTGSAWSLIKGYAVPLTVPDGGTGASTLTGVVSGNGVGAFTASNTLSGLTLTSPAINTPIIKFTDVTKVTGDSPYTIAAGDSVIRADASSGALTVTLPTAIGITGKKYLIRRIDILASSVLVTVATTSSQTIDGSANHYLWPGEFVEVESDGANWIVTNRTTISPHTLFIKGVTADRVYYAGQMNMWGILGTSTTSPAANTLWAFPFVVPKTTKFDVVGFRVTTGAAINARCGIYRDNGNLYPGALIFDTGNVDCTATGRKDTTITAGLQIFPAGVYWLAWECASNTIQMYTLASTGSMVGVLGNLTTSSQQGVGYSVAHTYGALPDPYTAAATVLIGPGAPTTPYPAVYLRSI